MEAKLNAEVLILNMENVNTHVAALKVSIDLMALSWVYIGPKGYV